MQNTVHQTLFSYRALNPKQHSTCKKQPLHLQVKVNNPPETKLQENLGKWVSIKLVEEMKNFMFHLKSGCFVWGRVGFFCLSVWLGFFCFVVLRNYKQQSPHFALRVRLQGLFRKAKMQLRPFCYLHEHIAVLFNFCLVPALQRTVNIGSNTVTYRKFYETSSEANKQETIYLSW